MIHDYPASLDVRPLTTWPGTLTPDHRRQRSPFSAPLRSTLDVLDRELHQLGAKRPVLEVAIPASQFRLDGRPRAAAKAEHPGVVLSLPQTDVGPLRYATDRFETWQDNLRAIALGLEALRRVDRYGITKRGEQYAGFRAIEAAPREEVAEDQALEVIARWGESTVEVLSDDTIALAQAAQRARRRSHPDLNGGDHSGWYEVENAMKVLGVRP